MLLYLDLKLADCSTTLTAKLLVAADGGHSQVRSQLGVDILQRHYGQSAIIANLSPELPHQNIAYECFCKSGPLALLPMSDDRCSLVYTVAANDCASVLALDDDAFLAQVRKNFGAYLGGFIKVGQRSAYPLELIQAREHSRPRLAIIGNAAHTLHPIAGQGFNLGLRDVAVLAEVIVDKHYQRQDIGSRTTLQRYTDWRRSDQRRAVLFTDSLARLFSNDWPTVKTSPWFGAHLV